MSIFPKVPLLKEIQFVEYSQEYVRHKLAEEALNYHGPILLNLETVTSNQTHLLLDFISKALMNLKMTPPYPYPLFILSPHLKSHPLFCIYQKRQQIPRHFEWVEVSLGKKDTQQLKKVLVYRQKIIGRDYEKKNTAIRQELKKNRAYYELGLEAELLTSLLKELKK